MTVSVKQYTHETVDNSTVFWREVNQLKSSIRELPDDGLRTFAERVTTTVLVKYWNSLFGSYRAILPVPVIPEYEPELIHDTEDELRVANIARSIIGINPSLAAYRIGQLYTSLLPDNWRTSRGIYYTPPVLSERLLVLTEASGINWCTTRVLDPACGGGAFLSPVALRIVKALQNRPEREILSHLAAHITGYEIDAFSAWAAQTLLEAALIKLTLRARERLPIVVKVCNTLDQEPGALFDLVIGNPPYGRKVEITQEQRDRFRRSLFGHPNAYGLFMDFAARHTKNKGIIAYITPTGFLGGEYFKNLRLTMFQEAPPISIDIIGERDGVFAGVLQETLLATYRRGEINPEPQINLLSVVSETDYDTTSFGCTALPENPTEPWILPRTIEQVDLVRRMKLLPYRLRDYGYKVSTGPLVWNRHKDQLRDKFESSCFPIVWAEAVTSEGKFEYRVERETHKPFLICNLVKHEWLLTRESCVLVQRTTAKEQRRRLIAAELPMEFIKKHKAVSVENHLNMIRTAHEHPVVTPSVLAALLNSTVIDEAFRCISGSVAVSATELEALPLPSPDKVTQISTLLANNVDYLTLDKAIRNMYFSEEL